MAEAFYTGEVESELRRIGKIDYRMHKDSDREKCMEMIEEFRRESIYPHTLCCTECKSRGEIAVSNNKLVHDPCGICRMWIPLGNRWDMEDCFSTLYVQSEGMLTLI